MTNEYNERVFEASKAILSGMLAGPYFSVILVNTMSRAERTTLGQMMVAEAWDMASCLVDKYESLKPIAD